MEFNTTAAGIHVDGLLRDPEIYNILDTEALLNRPVGVKINDKSGAAGVAYWVNQQLGLVGGEQVERGIRPWSTWRPGWRRNIARGGRPPLP